ncbi:MAG: NAD(P)/FAD-dependent oxidoreductase [Gammaproteobacteria bacterium]|nr:NAD(P)/FAD-dependent oxidoreductase [Gammaproteobacteria bacterium]
MTQKLIVIGAGMAGMRFLEELLKQTAPEGNASGQAEPLYEIDVFNQEPVGGYNRIMLSPVLAGEKSLNDIMTHDEVWFSDHGIRLHVGKEVSNIDLSGKRLTTFCGETYYYDKLVIATGSKPVMLPVPGVDLPGVVSFRDMRDVEAMISASRTQQRAVVIGGGLLGLEAAYGLLKRGMHVTVVHRNQVLMNVQMDAEAGQLLRDQLEHAHDGLAGMCFKMGANTVLIQGHQRVESVLLDDGTRLPADLVVMAVGIRPNVSLAEQAGLQVNKGIIVNDQLQTSHADVYALGECVEHRGETYGLVAPLYEQAGVLAQNLVGRQADYAGSLISTMLKVTGVHLFSAGDFKAEAAPVDGSEPKETVIFRDRARQVYRKLVIKGNKLVGVLLYGDVTDANWLFDKLKSQADIANMRDTLIFGQGYE